MEYSVDAATRIAKDGIESVRIEMEPDADWTPVLIGLRGEEAVIILFELPPGLKDVMVDVLAGIAQEQGFQAMALVMTAWMARLEKADAGTREQFERGNVLPSEHPDRREVVIIQAIDAEIMRFETAEIERHDDRPPTLGPWTQFGGRGTELDGRFAVLRDALR